MRRRRPRLDLGRALPPVPASVILSRAAGEDPLTGHRGAGEGTAVVAKAGPYTVIAHASRDERGIVLRGQAMAPDPLWLRGGLVHVRGADGAALGALDAAGEFVVRGWSGRLVAIDLELEDGFWRIPWPAPPPAEAP